MRRKFTAPDIASSEITSESAYLARRDFVKQLGLAAAPLGLSGATLTARANVRTGGAPLTYQPAQQGAQGFRTDESVTPSEDFASYCNFYEFGTDKGDPARYAHEMTTDPWSIEVSGEVGKPGKLNLTHMVNVDSGSRTTTALGKSTLFALHRFVVVLL